MRNRHRVRGVASKALLQVLSPLVAFALDAGLSTQELVRLLRCAAVLRVAKQQYSSAKRINISGISATTGIPRSEVSKILKMQKNEPIGDDKQNSVSVILAAWYREPQFHNDRGQPADLPMYGRKVSFERLVKSYGRGIPPRAVLDELVRTKSVEVLQNQRIRVKRAHPIQSGMSPSTIAAFGARSQELLETMLASMRYPDRPQFVATISAEAIPDSAMRVLRREIENKGSIFLADLQEALAQESCPMEAGNDAKKVSVTVFCTEEQTAADARDLGKRRNFRRRS